MFGGTPSNLAISIMDRAKVEIIAGINLPMLIKLASLRKDKSLKETVEGAQEAGKNILTSPRNFWECKMTDKTVSAVWNQKQKRPACQSRRRFRQGHRRSGRRGDR